MSHLSLSDARKLFGDRMIEPAAVAVLTGSSAGVEGVAIGIGAAEAEAARDAGCFLVHRPARAADGRGVTLALLRERARAAGLTAFRGDDPWFAEQPFAAAEAVEPGWALFYAEPWHETLNRTYDAADAALSARTGDGGWRRRSAVEIAFDCLAVAAARGVRLLERAWDWSSTATEDGGFVNVGGFSAAGLDVLSYSRAVKHGALGVCPTLVRRDAR